MEAEKRWTLGTDVLLIHEGNYPALPIPLDSLIEIRMSYEPTRVQQNRYQCHLFTARGRCTKFQNEHYREVMDFEDRSKSYTDLVRQLVIRTSALNPACRFTTGTTWLNWLIQTGILTFSFLLVAFVFIAMGSSGTVLVAVKILVILVFLPFAGAWIVKNRPSTFSPPEVPAAILPKT